MWKSKPEEKGVKIMFGKETINEKRPVKAANIATSILAVIAAVLFVMSLANPAIAEEKMSTLNGEVVAVDSYANTLTVRSSEPIPSFAPGMTGGYTFTADKMTRVTSCAQNKALGDIGVGEKVTVTYHERDGKLFADAVELRMPIIIACVYSE